MLLKTFLKVFISSHLGGCQFSITLLLIYMVLKEVFFWVCSLLFSIEQKLLMLNQISNCPEKCWQQLLKYLKKIREEVTVLQGSSHLLNILEQHVVRVTAYLCVFPQLLQRKSNLSYRLVAKKKMVGWIGLDQTDDQDVTVEA